MHRVEAEKMGRSAYELGEVVGIKFYSVDTADSTAWPEQVGLVVVIHKYLAVETAVPSLLHGTGVLEKSKVLVWSKGIACGIYVVAVSRKIELAVVLCQVRCSGDMLHSVEIPVEKVVRNPHTTA